MSNVVVLRSTKTKDVRRLVVTWDLDFNIEAPDLDWVCNLPTFPLHQGGAAWRLKVGRREGKTTLSLMHGRAPVGRFGTGVLRLKLLWVSGSDVANLVQDATFSGPLPATRNSNPDGSTSDPWRAVGLAIDPKSLTKAARWANGDYIPAEHRHYRFLVEWDEPVAELVSRARDRMSVGLAQAASGLNLEQLPHNVRLFFPRAHQDGAELWVKGDILSRSSPYLKDLLASDFAEGQPRRSKRARTSGAAEVAPAPAQDAKDFDDSDDETDELLFSKKPPSLSQPSEADDISFRQITITQSAFSTYHAVLVYLQTGLIRFAPLSSSFPLSDPALATRRDFLSSKHDEDPSLPLPVSPTSAYRLAHLLQLEDLQKRCLEAVLTSLRPVGAAIELFSDMALAYDDLRKVVIVFAKENWEAVKASEGWKEKKASLKAGMGSAEEAAVLTEMLEAIADA
ncbi:hypothetical protein JCM10213_001989 [Rhodosporidiobolus nylandii]